MKSTKKGNEKYSSAGMCIAIGAGFGIIFGQLLGNIGMGIALGVAFGLVFTPSFSKFKKK